jgi:tyrosyl-tRNA synthetase
LNVTDEDLIKLLRIFSLRSRAELEALETENAGNPNALKRLLAAEMTERVHGKEALESVLKATEIAFNPKLEGDFLRQLSEAEFQMIASELDSVVVEKSALEQGVNIADLLAGKHSSLESKSEVRRAIKGGAIAINTEKVTDENFIVNASLLLHNKYMFLQNGKKNKFLLVAE